MAPKKTAPSGMSIIDNHISNGEFSQIYLLTGNEDYLVQQFKNKLLNAVTDTTDSMNFLAFKGDGIKTEVVSEFALTMPFFADRRVLLIEDSDFFKKGNDDINELLKELPETTLIIFVERNIDGRLGIYKTVTSKGTVATFDTPGSDVLEKWIVGMFASEEYRIATDAVRELILGVGSDMCAISNEVEKLKSYCFDKKTVTREDVLALCIGQVEGKIFDMMDALSAGDKKKVMELYADLIDLREPAMRILFNISKQFERVLKVKLGILGGKNDMEISQAAGVPYFTIRKYKSFAGAYSEERLKLKLELCSASEESIKSGACPDKLAVELLIINLLQ